MRTKTKTKTRARRVVRKVFTDVQRRKFCMAWKQAQKKGSTFKAFCKKIKVSENTMRSWLRKFNMPLPSGTRAKGKTTTRRNVRSVSSRSTRSSARRTSTKKSATKSKAKAKPKAKAKVAKKKNKTTRTRANSRTSARKTSNRNNATRRNTRKRK